MGKAKKAKQATTAAEAPRVIGNPTAAQRASVIQVITGLLERVNLGSALTRGEDGSITIRIPKGP
jgi:hypothetical protein